VAAYSGMDESYIWPDALDRDQITAASESEIVAVYPHRWAVPRDTWGHLFERAEQEIGILVPRHTHQFNAALRAAARGK
jgi:hypothetical protein